MRNGVGMKVLVNGIGNIGTTLLNLLVDHRQALGIDTIYAHKRSLHEWQLNDLRQLQQRGVVLCVATTKLVGFQQHLDDVVAFESIRDEVGYVFETSANGVGCRLKPEYAQWPNLLGGCAQGSEKGFGLPYMAGVNDEVILGRKWVQVVSCNTHASLAVLTRLAGSRLEMLEDADFVVVRRSEDLGGHERLVGASVVARHLDPDIGTHHAIDATDLLHSMGLSPRLTSSDVTTPSQLMHAFRFHLRFNKEVDPEALRQQLAQDPYVAQTTQFDSNKVFEFGRRYGRYGRLYAQMVVVSNNLLFTPRSIKGWAFIPQEGNTLVSTLCAFLWQTQHPQRLAIRQRLCAELIMPRV